MATVVGEILWLRIRFNNNPGDVSAAKHPYVVVQKDEAGLLEIAQLDSLKGKEYKVAFKLNHLVRCAGQTALKKDGFVQMDNSFMIDDYEGLSKYSGGTLTEDLTNDIVKCYQNYQSENEILENKQVYMSKTEIERLNK